MFIPDDLQDALAQQPGARETFDSLSDHLKYLHVRYVAEVVDLPSRESRIREIIDLLEKTNN